MINVLNVVNGVKGFRDVELEESYKEFLSNFKLEDNEDSRQLFINNDGLNWRKISARNEISLFMCSIIDNLDETIESDGLQIYDEVNQQGYCFLKDNNFTWREEENKSGELLLHIKDNDNKVTIKLNNKSDLKAVNRGADVYMLDEFIIGYL